MISGREEGPDPALPTRAPGSKRRGRSRCPGSLVFWYLPAALIASPFLGWASGAEPPVPSVAKSLPALRSGTSEGTVHLRGVIQHSTRGRGRGGAVRLDVLSDAGEPTAVLTVPDSTLDVLGLSLRRGETIEARGTMLPGKVPLLVVSEIVLEGRTIAIRESLDRGRRGTVSTEGSAGRSQEGAAEDRFPRAPDLLVPTPGS